MGMTAFLMVIMCGGNELPCQLFFPGKPKQNLNSEQITQICQILKTSGEETARIAAIEELRSIDGAYQPIAISALMETLKSDRKTGVRAEAAVALSKMRPVRQEVGSALENAISKDNSMRVRIQARSALLQYNLAGYRSVQGGSSVTDPLGQIAKEPNPPSTITKNPWNWLTAPFNALEQHGQDVSPLQQSDPQKQWPRPGKMVWGWVQGVMGYADPSQKDKISNQQSVSGTAVVPMQPRLPTQVSFPLAPELSPLTKPSNKPISEPEPSGPELGIPKP